MRKVFSILITFFLLPYIVFADFSQPSFTGYFTVDSQQNHSSGSSNALWASFSQTLNLPSTPSEDAPAIYLKMTAEDLGLKSHCKFFMALIVRTQFGSYLLRPEGDSGPYGPFGAVYYIGGADYASDPNNLAGHEVIVPFTKVEENYQFDKVTNLNQLRNFYFTGLLPTDSGDPTCYFSEGIQNYWVDASVKIGHGEDVLPNSSTTYQTTLRQTTETPEDLTFTIKTKKPYTGKTPVLIVPGVLGNDMFKEDDKLWLNLTGMFEWGDEFMDDLQFNSELKPQVQGLKIGEVVGNPSRLFDYSEGLIKEFSLADYSEDASSSTGTLYTFPYDWRYGVSGKFEDGTTNVDLLKKKIQEIVDSTGSDKVDVIAHSTGGLLVKKYVIDNASEHHLGKTVFVGVPNTGAPKAIKVFLQGDGFGVPWLADGEMKKLAANFPVVYDLAPSQRYFAEKTSPLKISLDGVFSSTEKTLNFPETQEYLENQKKLNGTALAQSKNLHTLDFDNYDLRSTGVDLYNIVGCKAGTISQVIDYQKPDGTHKTYALGNDTPGDGTVPLESATNLPISPDHKFYSLDTDHGKMLSQDGIRQQIVNIIAGTHLSTNGKITQDISQCKLKGKAIAIFSPVSIKVTDQDGKIIQVGEDGSLTKEISNADFNLMGERKFMYLPFGDGQNYNIELQGTGDGDFTLKIKDIDDSVQKMYVFANLPVTLNLKGKLEFPEEVPQLSLDSDGDGSWDTVLGPDSELDKYQAEDIIPPISTSTVTGNLSASASVSLAATDPIIEGHENETSGLLRTYYSINSSSYMTYSSPISFTEPGDYKVSFYSIDKAGNKEDEQVVNLTVASQPSGNQPTYSGGGGGSGCLDCQPPRDVALKFIKTENGKSFFSLSAKDESLPLSMQLSENKDMAKVVWQKFSGEIEWAFSTSTIKTLYARVRDSYLNSSNVVEAAGLWDETVSPGKVLGENTGVLAIHPTGSLVVDQNGTVYMVQGSVIRPFTSAKRFLKLKFKFKNVQAMWPGDSQFLLGMPM